jgi:hypothetical protein
MADYVNRVVGAGLAPPSIAAEESGVKPPHSKKKRRLEAGATK